MIPSYRQDFNAAWTPAKYARFLQLIEERAGGPPRFRHSETPCFFDRRLIERMAQAGREIVAELLANEQYRRESDRAIPAHCAVPNEAKVPLFVQADFGLDENLEPKLVEIQGFPSLYAWQPVLADCYREAFGLAPALSDVIPPDYRELLRRAVVADHDPENVVLLEIEPDKQKTRCDFVITEQWLGVRSVDITSLRKNGRQLFYQQHGRQIPIRRIYNRAIVDEIERKHVELPFDWRDDLDVEWAGHPNWFYRLSKFSLPYLRHPAVPRTRFLSDVSSVEHPERCVLKPLFSFAGLGVIVGPTREEIDSIPSARRGDYILQDRVDFRPVIETPAGAAKVEVRIMYIWLDEMRTVNTIVRMGRGAQMGVDHNRELTWVGASAGFLAS